MKTWVMNIIKVLVISAIVASVTCHAIVAYAQNTNSYSGHLTSVRNKDENKKRILAWWSSFSDCEAKKVIDTVRFEKSYEIFVAGQIDVQYHMYGTTSNGGIVKFKIRFDVTENLIEYRFYDLEHKSTPGVKHKDGGAVLEDKPLKGSMIFAKTWKAYQEQTMSFVHSAENEIIKVLNKP